ncbi:MFS transporter [Rhodococcus pseudokoreensis]|uniref:MFS transporter n=1 Tax=Rhodococcus pseudokoreensis TaxID=2811421 RepID=A0A974W955_9NOCA|nr:MFS transporter [Rhodococcus pseudokoreensis]QSE92987.1 MFS transporter [Rhodococcus pseudokoreensis]
MSESGTTGILPQRSWTSRVSRPWFARLMVVTFVAQFISSAIRPLITYESLAAGAGAVQVGVITAAFSVLALVVALPLGKAVDRRGETGFLVLGGVLVCSTLLSLLAPSSLLLLGVCSAFLGLGHLILVVASQTLIAKGSEPKRRDTRFATLTTVNAVAQIVAPAMTGFLVGEVTGSHGESAIDIPNSHIVLTIVSGMAVVATLSAISLKMWPGSLMQRPVSDIRPGRGSFSSVMRLPAVPAAMLASLTVLTSIDLLVAFLPVFGQQHGLSPLTVGLLLATEGVAAMVVRIWMVRLITRFTRRRLLIGTMTLAAISLSSLPVLGMLDRPGPALFAAMALAGLGLGIGQPATMAWVAAQTPVHLRGTAVSIRLSGNRLGQVVVPISAGALAGGLGLAAAFWWPAVLLLVSAGLIVRTPRTADPSM